MQENIVSFIHDNVSYNLPGDDQIQRPVELANGARILAYYPMSATEGIVLAVWRFSRNRDPEFVTWRASWVIEDGEARWECESGNYFYGLASEHDAWQDFAQRSYITPDDRQALTGLIARITSGVENAIPEQDDRDLAVKVLDFIEKELSS